MKVGALSCQASHLTLAFDVLRHVEVLAVPYDVRELADPVAKDYHARLLRQLQVYLDVAVPVDEVVDVRVVLYVTLGEAHQVFAVLAHIGRFLAIDTLQS